MNYLKNIYTKKHSLFILLFLSFAGISWGQSVQKTKVFLLAGQSNMDGRGDASKLTEAEMELLANASQKIHFVYKGTCLLYTSPSPRDGLLSRMPSSA